MPRDTPPEHDWNYCQAAGRYYCHRCGKSWNGVKDDRACSIWWDGAHAGQSIAEAQKKEALRKERRMPHQHLVNRDYTGPIGLPYVQWLTENGDEFQREWAQKVLPQYVEADLRNRLAKAKSDIVEMAKAARNGYQGVAIHSEGRALWRLVDTLVALEAEEEMFRTEALNGAT